jgi:hypothetical protein
VSVRSPTELFLPASEDPRDRADQFAMDRQLDALIRTLCAAIEHAFRQWQGAARLVGVRIDGATATLGRLEGPNIECLLQAMPALRGLSPWSRRLCEGVAGGFAWAWSSFCRSVSVPGLPWYPGFASFAGPCAPPTPNVPTPFARLAHDPGLLAAARLKAAMVRRTRGDTLHADSVLTAVASSLHASLLAWCGSQTVTHVFGHGLVPAFDPPRVGAGPVVAGEGTMTPGGFATAHP